VNGVSFALSKGETLGIVGESGCGKSTLAKLICRLVEPDSGSVCLDGCNITALRPSELRAVYSRMQMVFQSPAGSFDPRRTVGSAVEEALTNRGMPKLERVEKTAALFERCGLDAKLTGRYPHELSGGQCQRAAIARALAAEPDILICDEATSALDVTVQKQIIELLSTLKAERNLAVIFICHNLALVQLFCDRVLVMHSGEIVEEGSPDEVILAPKSPYTQSLVRDAL
jgi:oligopeptide transport system ATP-binding protein